MKNILLIATSLIVLVCASCSEDATSSVGDELLGANKLNVLNKIDGEIKTTNKFDEVSEMSGISTILLGTLNDDVFGKTRSSAAFQLRLRSAPTWKNSQYDSVKLFLSYKGHYGVDSLKKQTAKVYLLKKALEKSKSYTIKTDIQALKGEEVGSQEFYKDLVSDTIFHKSKVDPTKDSVKNNKKVVDTVYNHLAIKLDDEKVGKYIFNAPETAFSSVVDFVNYFNGFYVNTEDFSGSQGAIYGFDAYNSFLRVYYRAKLKSSKNLDSLSATRAMDLPVTDNSVRFNHPEFDRKSEITADKDKIYLQGIHGTKAKVEMPELKKWADMSDITINNAKLVFHIATDSQEAKKYPLPMRLELVAVDTDNKKTYLNNSALSGIGNFKYNGLLNVKDNTYTFFIPEYLQEVVNKKQKFHHFEIATSGFEYRRIGGRTSFHSTDAKDMPNRVVLHGTGEHKPTLSVTYTKY